MRWTEALALYDMSTDEVTYKLTLFRAAQLFEHCILTRRIFRTDGEQIADLSPKVRFFTSVPAVSPNWSKANKVLSAFSRAESDMVGSPVQSVEAEELVNKAVERFGIPTLIDDTRRSYDLLDRRLQWFRGQWVALSAVFVFLIPLVITVVFKK